MAGEFTYLRKYIIFKNNYTNIEGIEPKGHGKLEIRGIKGSISLNVDNCEPYGNYKVYFLKDMAGQIEEYDLGRVLTDELGSARIKLDFNAKNLEAEGFIMDQISAVLIRRDDKLLLNGYIGKDDGTVDRFIEKLLIEDFPRQEIEEETDEEIEYIDPVEEMQKLEREEYEELQEREERTGIGPVEEVDGFEKDEESDLGEEVAEQKVEEMEEYEEIEEIEEYEEMQEYEEYSEEEEEIEVVDEPREIDQIEELRQEPEDTLEIEEEEWEEYEEAEESEETAEIEKQIEMDDSTDYQSLEYIRQLNHKNQMTDYILNILRFFPYVDPFNIYLHGYSWWKIEEGNADLYQGFLPYYNYLMSTDYRYGIANNSTTCIDLIERYGHYIFGMYKEGKDVKYYLYGVPGEFITQEHPFRGVTGFNTWYESQDGLGYWILYIDPMTGKVVRIINPMIPEY